MKKLISILSAICLVVTMIPFSAYAANITPEISLEEFSEQLSEMNEEYADEPVSNRIIVKSERKIDKLDSVDIVEGYDDLHIIQFDNSESASEALEYYENNKYIEYAEPDLVVSTFDCNYDSNDILQDSDTLTTYDNHLSWGSEVIGIDDYIDYLDTSIKLPEIVVGIIDTGIDIDHEFLKDRVIETGFNISSSGGSNGEDDDNGHGTHVAGIIADNSTNNIKLKGYKVLNSDGKGTISAIITAIETAISDNVNIINMSLGSRGKSELMEQTISKAIQNNVTVCVAAGNEGDFAKNYTPAGIEECITVAAIDIDDNKPYWSNYGEIVDIVAPGVSIYSTYKNNTYETLSGTSMACPFVTAAAAMVLSKNINYNSAEICDILIDSGRDWVHTSNGLMHTKCVYLGNIDNYNSERTATPKTNYSSGKYVDSITVELTCDTENAEIYYTLDGSRASQDNGILYTEPIVIDKVTKLSAVAYSMNRLKSLQIINNYYICYTDDDSNFEISSEGTITAYNGNSNYLTIPEEIQGITVTGIGNSVFFKSDLTMIKLPDTCTYIGSSAFNFCRKLCYVQSKSITEIGNRAFFMCRALNEINLDNLEKLGSEAFMATALISAKADKLETISKSAFCNCYAMYFDFPNAKTVENSAFSGCLKLETIKIPNAESLAAQAFNGCRLLKELYIPRVKTIGSNVFPEYMTLSEFFVPGMISAQSLPKANRIYLSDKCINLPNVDYKYTVVAPSGSYAEQYANENGHTFIPSDYRDENVENPVNVSDLGRSICTSVAGVRFGFTWDHIDEIESLASDIEYGFIYSQKGAENLSIDTVDDKNIKKAIASNRVDHGDTTSFNLVISNIPTTYYNREITARAYVCIDGMYFYSNVRSGSFNEVANLVLADEEIDTNTKNAIHNLLGKEV